VTGVMDSRGAVSAMLPLRAGAQRPT
jgi:hypothetical protein